MPIIDSLKKTIPLNQSTDFNGNVLLFNFNEFIVLDEPKKNILITPIPETPPVFTVKGKRLYLEFTSILEDNTTYNINFGNAIKDITEGNIFTGYNFAFSTGPVIDTASFSAYIYDAFTKKPLEQVLVMLYKTDNDSLPLNSMPYYASASNSNGEAVLENLAPGDYKIFLLEDGNDNYKFDDSEERIGFSENLITVTDSVSRDTFKLFINTPDRKLITEWIDLKHGRYAALLNHDFTEQEVVLPETLKDYFLPNYKVGMFKDSVYFWVNPEINKPERLKLTLNNLPSINAVIELPQDSSLTLGTNVREGLAPGKNIVVTSSQPITDVNSDLIMVEDASRNLDFQTYVKHNQLHIIPEDTEEPSYNVTLLPNAISSIYGLSNDTLTLFFDRNEPNDYGSVLVNINTQVNHPLIVELIKENKIVGRQIVVGKELNQSLRFDLLKAGNYELRIIYDSDNSGTFTSGNYFQKLQPERVEYYSEPIEVRKGWDVEIEWTIE